MVQAVAVTEEVAALRAVDGPTGSLQRLRRMLDEHPGSLRIVLAGSSDMFPGQFRLFQLNSTIVVEPTAALICKVQMRWLQEHFLPTIGLRGERSRLSAPDVPNWQFSNSRAQLIESEADLRAIVEKLTADDYDGHEPRLCVHEFSSQSQRCEAGIEISGDTLRFTVPLAVEQNWELHRAHLIRDLTHTAGPHRG